MEKDKRIVRFRRAVRAMATGHYDLQVPASGDDDVALLGRDLDHLARSLDHRFEEFKALARVTEQINEGLLVMEVLNHVFDNFHRFIPYNRIGFALLEEDPEQGTLVRAHWARSDLPHMRIRSDYIAPLKGSSLEHVIDTGEPRILNDLKQYLIAHPDSHSTRLIVEEGIRSSLTCPLVAMGKPVGFLFFSSVRRGTYRNAHVEIFQEIAGQLSIIVEKSRLYQSLLDLTHTRSRFLGMAAHDLRNPIISLQRGLALLSGKLGDLPDEAEREQTIARMEQSCRRMVVLIEDMLDVSAIDGGTLRLSQRRLDLKRFMEDICRQMEPVARAKLIEWHCDINDQLGEIWADPDRLEQIMENLLSNAIKYSYSGSRVIVSATRNGNTIKVSVTDHGQGIPADELPKLFKPFGRTSAKPTGGEPSTGLGLLITKRLVEAHGGLIWAESIAGKGTNVHFTLPAYTGQ